MTDNEKLESLVDRLVHANDPEEVKGLYRQWANTYDKDLDAFGYVAPQIGTALCARLIPEYNARIHDAGCGTGQVGKLLTSVGYKHIDGSDFSTDMLDKARESGCYQQLCLADYSQPVDLADNSYDGVISIGVYTKRFKQHFLPQMLRIIKPGGYMVFSCRPLYYEEVAGLVMKLHIDEQIDWSSIHNDDYMVGQGARAFYVSLKKAA